MKPRRVWVNLRIQLLSFKREKHAVFFTILFPLMIFIVFSLNIWPENSQTLLLSTVNFCPG